MKKVFSIEVPDGYAPVDIDAVRRFIQSGEHLMSRKYKVEEIATLYNDESVHTEEWVLRVLLEVAWQIEDSCNMHRSNMVKTINDAMESVIGICSVRLEVDDDLEFYIMDNTTGQPLED